MFELNDKIAIVTGASRGIGAGIARRLAAAGAHVVCVSRTAEAINAVAESLIREGWQASAFPCDVSTETEVKDLVTWTLDQYQQIDILVNNAGVTRDTLLMRMSDADWDTVMEINLKGAFHTIRAVTRPMLKRRYGRIINISSVVGLSGNAGQANYAASKAGLIGLTKAVAKELASRGITVNCIAPGYIETDMTAGLSAATRESLLQQIPLGRIGQAQDVAAAVHFLASDEAGYITGQTVTVDGGMVMS
jgi:3-oxoacyl-[acyl-carrier protein] reductase